jgi:hypothetical protein
VEAKFHMYCFVCADDLMKPYSFVRVVKRWCGMHIDPILRCFDNLEGLNNGGLPSRRGSRVHELDIGLRPSTAVTSQDLSGAWVTMHG